MIKKQLQIFRSDEGEVLRHEVTKLTAELEIAQKTVRECCDHGVQEMEKVKKDIREVFSHPSIARQNKAMRALMNKYGEE